jgi:hypothetical protein
MTTCPVCQHNTPTNPCNYCGNTTGDDVDITITIPDNQIQDALSKALNPPSADAAAVDPAPEPAVEPVVEPTVDPVAPVETAPVVEPEPAAPVDEAQPAAEPEPAAVETEPAPVEPAVDAPQGPAAE